MRIQNHLGERFASAGTSAMAAMDPNTGQEIPGPLPPTPPAPRPPIAPRPAERATPVNWLRPAAIAGAVLVITVGGVALFRITRASRSSLRVLDERPR